MFLVVVSIAGVVPAAAPQGCGSRVIMYTESVWIWLGVPVRLGHASGGASGRDSWVRWFQKVRRL